MSQLFSIGKVIQIRTDPVNVRRLAFVETKEHIRHVVEMLKWLYPCVSDILCRAAELHDIGKKVYLQPGFVRNGRRRDRRLTQDGLRDDFYGRPVKEPFTASDAIARYLAFLEQGMHVKSFVMRQNLQDDTSQSVAVRYQLDPPFGNHAASVERDDLQGISDDKGDYIHSLIQLHHNFQVDKLVAAAAQHGQDIIADLYRLMTADQEGSRWAEYVVQKLEDGKEGPQSKFGFSEFAVEAVSEPVKISHNGAHIQGEVTLQATRHLELGERTLRVDYYVGDCDLSKFISAKKKGGKKNET